MISENKKDWTGNGNSIWKTLGASNHTDKERETDDYYATDPIAINKLRSVEQFQPNVWECAAGEGHLSRRLSLCTSHVYSSDIKERNYKLDAIMDFLSATKDDIPFEGVFDIITNPPYKHATEFVLKALELLPISGKCCMFLKLTFLEGKKRFNELYSHTPRDIYVFSERIMCAKKRKLPTNERGRWLCRCLCLVCLGKRVYRRH